jgi:hypothetical protein
MNFKQLNAVSVMYPAGYLTDSTNEALRQPVDAWTIKLTQCILTYITGMQHAGATF